jgi:hypothetical protein
MTNEPWTVKDLEGSSHGLIEVLSKICLEGLRKTMKSKASVKLYLYSNLYGILTLKQQT